jgi:pyruvate dehydrogenase E2 component (dihydrolipoamide acetyltransferase)
MVFELVMPKFGMTMKTAKVIQWLKAEGEPVEKDETVLVAENEKFTNDVQSLGTGTLLRKVAQVGEEYAIGDVLAYLGDPGEKVPAPGGAAGTGTASVARGASPEAAVASTAGSAAAGSAGSGGRTRVIASPLAKKLASQLGIDISRVQGKGTGGRVEKADVEAYAAEQAASGAGQGAANPTESLPDDYTVIPYTGMRRAVGENMLQAWTSIPMVTHHVDADAGELLELREKLNAGVKDKDGRISVNDLLMKLTAAALVQAPVMNATFESGEIRAHKHIHLGMAVALENGLIVPVIRRAEQKSLLEISREARELAAKARSGRLTYDDTADGTFTVSNLGGYGSVDFFTPIINPPQAAILGVGRIRETAVPAEGELRVRPMLALSLTYDHRVMDGAAAAEFMRILIGFISRPFRTLLG